MSQADYIVRLVNDLKPLEIFDYYDGPKFYSCQDKAGQLYLVYWIDEVNDLNSWLYLRVSQERYNALKVGNISIANVLSCPEDGSAFIVDTHADSFSVREISFNEIISEWLPEKDDFRHC